MNEPNPKGPIDREAVEAILARLRESVAAATAEALMELRALGVDEPGAYFPGVYLLPYPPRQPGRPETRTTG